jgi:hypothetical protein
VKVLVRKGSDEILGATIVASHAGDLLSEISVAMSAKLGLGKLANVIHPYPAVAEAIRKCGDAYNRTKLTPTVKNCLNLAAMEQVIPVGTQGQQFTAVFSAHRAFPPAFWK